MNLREKFDSEGYIVIRNLLTNDEARHYRMEIQKLSGLGDADFGEKHFECPDGVTKNPVFWPLIFHRRLLDAIRQILGPAIRYTQHSDVHAHRIGGWHRDCSCRKYGAGPDWQPDGSPYHVVRVAIYLQSYAESGSALGVIPGSHRPQKTLSPTSVKFWSKYRNLASRFKTKDFDKGKNFPWIQTSKIGAPILGRPVWPVWLKTEPGDTIIFDQRCYHSASDIHGPKYAVFLSYSPPDEHALNHLHYFRKLRPDLKYGVPPEDLLEKLKKEELYCEPEFTDERDALLRQHCFIPAAGTY